VARKYATDPEYANKVIRLMDLYDLRRFDAG
jgi:flagellum-specific peptidoglycan hydrolase FlgJ